jgi:hypothetical protein
MMEQQARRSGAVMGFDTHMVARSRACSTRPTHPTITNETSPHYAEALVLVGCWSGLGCGQMCR